jgi:sorting nexin-1/2
MLAPLPTTQAAPPPYASVIGDFGQELYTEAGSLGAPQQQQQQQQPEFVITVTDPVKVGDSVASSYVVFKVRTRSRHPAYAAQPTAEVTRRFSHFTWLAEKLAQSFKGCIVPPVPEKSTVQKFQMATEFIEQRRRALEVGLAAENPDLHWDLCHAFAPDSPCLLVQVFVNKVATHPVLKDSKELHQFLVASEHDWALEMARWTAETNAAKPPAVNGALQWLKSLQHTAQNMVSGRYVNRLQLKAGMQAHSEAAC